MDAIVLRPGDMVTAAGFLFAHKVSSIESFVAKFGWDLDEHLGRAVERGESLAWVNGHIVTLVGDKAAALRNAEKARRDREAATVLKNGDLVEIEGRRYTVRINGERYSNPFKFVKIDVAEVREDGSAVRDADGVRRIERALSTGPGTMLADASADVKARQGARATKAKLSPRAARLKSAALVGERHAAFSNRSGPHRGSRGHLLG